MIARSPARSINESVTEDGAAPGAVSPSGGGGPAIPANAIATNAGEVITTNAGDIITTNG